MKDQIVTLVPAPVTYEKPGPLWTAGVVVTSLVALVFLAATLWVWHAVPVSAQDLKDASWLFGYRQTVAFSTTSFGLGVTMAFLGLAVGIVKRQRLVAVQGMLVGAAVMLTGMQSLNFVAAADSNTAKVGCFSWETKECHALLGLAGADALPSMYGPRAQADRTGDVYTPEYEKQISAQRASAGVFLPDVSAVPMMPLIAMHTDALNAKLNAQRAEIARRRAAESAAAAAVKH